VLEVATPLLARHTVTDPHIDSLSVVTGGGDSDPDGADAVRFLQTSPEYAMKRLLAAGFPSIYQMGSCFRAGENGARHNSEFTMLEWYRLGFSLDALIDEVEALMLVLDGVLDPLPDPLPDPGPEHLPKDERALTARFARVAYGDLFERAVGINPHQASDDALRAVLADTIELSAGAAPPRNDCLDLLFSQCVQPGLTAPTFVVDYPASQSALAELGEDASGQPVARRFEFFAGGVELANGYFELRDGAELEARMREDNRLRLALGKDAVSPDECLLAALDAGLPLCSGVALGIERVLMVLLGKGEIDQVIAFSAARS
jgi:lysyl-tRNA synthetase class 2